MPFSRRIVASNYGIQEVSGSILLITTAFFHAFYRKQNTKTTCRLRSGDGRFAVIYFSYFTELLRL